MSATSLLEREQVECAYCKDSKPASETTWFMAEPGEKSVRLCDFCYEEARKQLGAVVQGIDAISLLDVSKNPAHEVASGRDVLMFSVFADEFAFATGCLIAAWREMVNHGEGRLVLANYGLALGLLLPLAGLQFERVIGVSSVFPGQESPYGLLALGAGQSLFLVSSQMQAVPALLIFKIKQLLWPATYVPITD